MAYSRKKPARKPFDFAKRSKASLASLSGKTADGKRTKPKKSADVRAVSENEIHMKAWQWVSKTYPALLVFHVANERQAAIQYHMKLKRLGVLAGVADFLAFPGQGRSIAIELKDDANEQDADQIQFQKRWERMGGGYFLVRTLDDFKLIISAMMLFG